MVGLLTNFLTEQRVVHVLPYVKGKILDLGCGDATILNHLPDRSVYTGVDSRQNTVDKLKGQYPGVKFLLCDLDKEPVTPGETYDTVIMTAVIEHLERPQAILSQVPGLLNPGGRLLITTPTPGGNRIHHLGSFIGLFSKGAADEHKFIFNRQSLDILLRESRMKMVLYHRFLFGQNQLCVGEAAQEA